MNILITIPSLNGKGGVSYYYRTIFPYLNKSLDYKISHIEIGDINGTNKLFHVLKDQYRVYKHISHNKVDLIHVNPSLDPKSLLRDGMFTLLAKRKKIPVVVFFHGWHCHYEHLFEGKLRYFAKKMILNADCFIVLSSSFKEKLKEWGVNVPVFVESTIVDDNLLSEFSIKTKINKLRNTKKIKILFLARIEKEKGIFETISAFKILQKRGHSVFLTIAGDGTAMQAAAKYLATNNLNKENTKFLGYVSGDKKITALKSHIIYCLPTYHGEGMPTSVLEAMAFGMPVVTRPVGGLNDFFENGKMGYLTKKKDPETIANLLEKLVMNKQKMINMAFYNHEYAKKHFLASKAATRIRDLHKKIFFKNKN